ncbi:unnamed protein product [Sphenostylis stenocarpa]|uniref:Uncharacterized protein n=1 Tax=Sphenostylis stenocarpa TaxID=92480 RepID=A0AA86VNQ1_9FABA|nr:unnamed protein product [Sphenostylis stenocarpa]
MVRGVETLKTVLQWPDYSSCYRRKKLFSVLSESGKTSSFIDDISIVKLYASESTNAIPVTSDDEALAKTIKEVKNDEVNFIWTRFSELRSYMKDAKGLYKRLIDTMGSRACENNFDNQEDSLLRAPAEVKEILARMDARIHNLYMSLPTNAQMIIFTGHEDTAFVRW